MEGVQRAKTGKDIPSTPDALVFLIIEQNTVAARHRHAKWPADFNITGNIYCDRWPMGDPVIM